MNEPYDLVILGGGSAGLTAASFGVQLGLKTAIVEKHRLGGDCTWTGCVPSKTLLKTAKVAHEMRTAGRYGLSPANSRVDLKTVMQHVQEVIADVYHEESPEALRADGIDVYLESARFLDPHTLQAGSAQLRARHFLISTGARPFVPPIAGLNGVGFLTYETIWSLEELPQHLLVVGGGPIGCEMAQAFRRLGSAVTLMEGGNRLLSRDDSHAANTLAQVLQEEGVTIRLNSKVQRASQVGQEIHLETSAGQVSGDVLLVAVGRHPNVEDLGLEEAGVRFSPKGIQVDSNLRTTQRHIYAAGDCVGGYQFTHYAGWQAFMAVRNAFLPGAAKGVSDFVPWTTFTDPEVAHVGLTEAEARQKFGDQVMTCEWDMCQVDRARAEGERHGFIKLVHRPDGTLLGATIVAGRAGEMLHEWIVALDRGLKVGDLAGAIHVYPTYATASMQAAAAVRVGQLLSGTSGKVIRGLARLMG